MDNLDIMSYLCSIDDDGINRTLKNQLTIS